MGKEEKLDISGLKASWNGGNLKEQNYKNYDSGKERRGSNKRDKNQNNSKNRNKGDSNSIQPRNNNRTGNAGGHGGNYSGQGRSGGGNYSGNYVGAPYNFISVPNPHALPADSLAAHNEITEQLLTGEIVISVTAQTHLFIGDGNKSDDLKDGGRNKKDKKEEDFVKNNRGQYIIPGSSLRGLIRNNSQILGRGDIGQDVDDYSLMYRAVAGGKERKNYSDILGTKLIIVNGHQIGILKNVQAGYIRRKKEGEGYEIVRTAAQPIKDCGLMNYYVLNERYLINDHKKNPDDDSFSFFFNNPSRYLQHLPNCLFKREERKDFRGRVVVHYKGKRNENYIPYVEKCLYKLEGDRKVTAVKPYNEEATGYKKGWVISSGNMQEKKAVYVIPEADESKGIIPIPAKDQEAFEVDYQRRKTILGKEKEKFYALPSGNEMKPVFYVELDGHLYFGFTPRPRLFYAHTIKENLRKQHPGTTLDYPSSMFGYSRMEKKEAKKVNRSYKSKLSFSDAVIVSKGDPKDPNARNIQIVLSEPKPTSIADYLKQDGPNVNTSYNDDNFELRGVKQYWLHSNANIKPEVNLEKQGRMITRLNPLKPGTEFIGKIRFHSLNRLELGLLLWALKLDDNSWMNIGKAKSFGYGAIKLEISKVKILDYKKAYSLDGLTVTPWGEEDVDVDTLINDFKIFLYGDGNGGYIEPVHIRDFLAMKNSTNMPDEAKIRFMKIDDGSKVNEYKNRRALPTVQETLKK